MVVEVMQEAGVDISDCTPREVTVEELQWSDLVVTMGCSADGVCPAGLSGENRDWDLEDPDDRSREEVATIRDEIERRVAELFEEFSGTEGDAVVTDSIIDGVETDRPPL